MNHLVESSKRSAGGRYGDVPAKILACARGQARLASDTYGKVSFTNCRPHRALLQPICRNAPPRGLPKVDDVAAWMRDRQAEEDAVTSRAEVIRIFESGTAEVLAALDTLSDEDVAVTLDSGQGWTMPMSFLMGLAGWRAERAPAEKRNFFVAIGAISLIMHSCVLA